MNNTMEGYLPISTLNSADGIPLSHFPIPASGDLGSSAFDLGSRIRLMLIGSVGFAYAILGAIDLIKSLI